MAATVPPTRLTLIAPAAGVNVPAQLLLIFGMEATTRLGGNVSVKARFVSANALGLVIIRVSVEGLPAGTVVGENDLAIEGGKVGCTSKVLLAASPVEVTPLLIVVTAVVTLL